MRKLVSQLTAQLESVLTTFPTRAGVACDMAIPPQCYATFSRELNARAAPALRSTDMTTF